MNSSQNQPIPTRHVRYVFAGMISLMNKYRNVPDLSTIHDSLKVMQVEAKSASEETPQALAKVKDRVYSNIVEFKKCTATGEETKALAKEATEVGKTAVGIVREVKNKRIQAGGGSPMSYAAVAASGTFQQAHTIHKMPRT